MAVRRPARKATRAELASEIAKQRRRDSVTRNTGRSTSESKSEPEPEATPWPAPLEDEVYYGAVGEWRNLIRDQTEADDAALVATFLAYCGVILGRNSGFELDTDVHYGNIFPSIVGSPGSSRKGTSLAKVERLMRGAFPEWVDKWTFRGGLSSTEGLLQRLSDDDGAASAKQVLFRMGELTSFLAKSESQSNTILETILECWDSDRPPAPLTVGRKYNLGSVHLGLVGHCTPDRFRSKFRRTVVDSGLASRLLWFLVKRDRSIPLPQRIPEHKFVGIHERLRDAKRFAEEGHDLKFSSAAKDLWYDQFNELTHDRGGDWGAATSRAAAQVIRVAVNYTLIDIKSVIDMPHLLAALQLWAYSEESSRLLLEGRIGTGLEEEDVELREFLRANTPPGVTKTEIHEHFHRNRSAGQINASLRRLSDSGQARFTDPDASRTKRRRGRRTELWAYVDGGGG